MLGTRQEAFCLWHSKPLFIITSSCALSERLSFFARSLISSNCSLLSTKRIVMVGAFFSDTRCFFIVLIIPILNYFVKILAKCFIMHYNKLLAYSIIKGVGIRNSGAPGRRKRTWVYP